MIIPGGGKMEPEEVVIEETDLDNEGIEPFDWEDLLYESWLEEHLQKKKRKLAEAGA
jgi:hypothetical protein